MFAKLRNFFRRKKHPVSASFPSQQIAGRSTRPIYTPWVSKPSQNTHSTHTNSDDFVTGYVAATVISDLLESSSKTQEPVEQIAPSEKSSWSNDYGSKSDSWSSSSSSSDSWSSSSSSDSWSSSDSSSGGSDW
jgi:hypothetical protein